MRTALLALFVLLLAGTWWLVRRQQREPGSRLLPAASAEAHDPESSSELAPVQPIEAEEGTVSVDVDSPGPARARIASRGLPVPVRIHGRVVMAGTWEPLEEVLSVRLRSLDLSLIDPVETLPDGSFVSNLRFPSGGVLACVRTLAGRVLVDHEGAFDPQSPEPWLVPVPRQSWPTFVRGRVVDLHGEPVDDAVVVWRSLEERVPSAWSLEGRRKIVETEVDGAFEIGRLDSGTHELQIVGRYMRSGMQRVAVRLGANEIGDLVLPSPGPLQGRVVAREEPWGLFFLREIRTGKELSVLPEDEDDSDDGVLHFRISGLPDGDHELWFVPGDGLVYEPASMRVRPPAEGLEFRVVPADELAELSVRDAKTGEELDSRAFSRVRGRWIDGLHALAERCLVWAADHRPASVDPAALHSADSPAIVYLEPGWGQLRLYEILDVEPGMEDLFSAFARAPLAGVRVLADGVPVAASAEDGMAMVGLSSEPGRLEQELEGWRAGPEDGADAMLRVLMMPEAAWTAERRSRR